MPKLMSLGNSKFKQWDTTIYLLEWLQSKTLATPNIDKDLAEEKHSTIAARNTQWYSYFGRQFGDFLQN
jgi:hypothetical protein